MDHSVDAVNRHAMLLIAIISCVRRCVLACSCYWLAPTYQSVDVPVKWTSAFPVRSHVGYVYNYHASPAGVYGHTDAPGHTDTSKLATNITVIGSVRYFQCWNAERYKSVFASEKALKLTAVWKFSRETTRTPVLPIIYWRIVVGREEHGRERKKGERWWEGYELVPVVLQPPQDLILHTPLPSPKQV